MASKRHANRADADAFFAGDALGLAVLDRVAAEIAASGGAQLRVARTQVGWARRRGFVFLWSPASWLGARGAPLVLTVYLPLRLESPRFKEIVEVRAALWGHHLELRETGEVDDEVLGWVRQAYDAAG